MSSQQHPPFWVSLISGGIAGTTVDVALYPLDTIKTRLQSPQGFIKAGAFRGIYKGLSAAAVGSSPGAALFFGTYDSLKNVLRKSTNFALPVQHMIAASFGEIMACFVRVPTEVVKQRMQTGMFSTMSATISHTIKTDGFSGMFRGFGITIMREIPFSLIQFPLYEILKPFVARQRASLLTSLSSQSSLERGNTAKNQNREGEGDVEEQALSLEGAMCGSVSGAIAAALTTPLDVIKTRVMLGTDPSGQPYSSTLDCAKRVWKEGSTIPGGSSGFSLSHPLLRGLGPRVFWISLGGFVYFGAYEKTKSLLFPPSLSPSPSSV